MDDLIKRSDAIKAFVEETNGVNVEEAIKVVDAYLQIRECDEIWDSIRAIRDCLECAKDEIAEYIPSAEEEEFEWCHDCKEYDQDAHCCHRFSKRIRQAVEEIKADRPQGEWIFKPTFPNDDSEFPMGHLECSVCGSHHANAHPCNYCDNCGSRNVMKGADDDK